ncbi:MAG: carboxymuconolactone decarboxylase family protein [Thermoanaerobacterales bacterium]|jgi:AhpD family alkylhydroperoxidase|nr:carboxymuconolactone decarboxylase family protein [Thermoanaerobacterales bacterium]
MTTTTTATTTPPADAAEGWVPRIGLKERFPAAYRALAAVDATVSAAGHLEPELLDLVKLRASQLNGCAYCLDLHSRDLRDRGESPQRLDVLSAWREVPLFSERERAALALTEAITRVGDTHVPDDVVDAARAVFDEDELAQLVFEIVVINAWNRVAVTDRLPFPAA